MREREIEREYTEYTGDSAMSTATYQCWSIVLSAAGVAVLAVYTFFTFRLFQEAQQQTALSIKQLRVGYRPIIVAKCANLVPGTITLINIGHGPALDMYYRYANEQPEERHPVALLAAKEERQFEIRMPDIIDNGGSVVLVYRSLDDQQYDTLIRWDNEDRTIKYAVSEGH